MTTPTQTELWNLCDIDLDEFQRLEEEGSIGLAVYDGVCAYGCKFFAPLEDPDNWGICFCPKSPRAGKLTFENTGCFLYEVEDPMEDPRSEYHDIDLVDTFEPTSPGNDGEQNGS